MFKTRSKQGIEEKGGGHSNVSKNIVKQGLEGGLGYFSNVPMAIGNSEFEGGVDTCVHKWKTDDIYNRKPSGRLHAEKKQQDCGAPPHPGEWWSGINPPISSTDNKVTTNMLRKLNQHKRHKSQEE